MKKGRNKKNIIRVLLSALVFLAAVFFFRIKTGPAEPGEMITGTAQDVEMLYLLDPDGSKTAEGDPSESVLPLAGAGIGIAAPFGRYADNITVDAGDNAVWYSLTDIDDMGVEDLDQDPETILKYAEERALIPDKMTLYKTSDRSSSYSDTEFSIEGNVITIGLTLDINDKVLYSSYPEFSVSGGSCEYIGLTEDNGLIDLTEKPTLRVTNSEGEFSDYTVCAEYLTDLPVLHIDLNDPSKPIERYNTVSANLMIDGENYPMDIRGRGNTSWWSFAQKAYLLKLDDRVPLLGWDASDKWILVPTYIDRTLIRNPVSMKMASVMDNLEYTPQQIPADVFLNGEYAGVYTFSECLDAADDKVDLFTGDTYVPGSPEAFEALATGDLIPSVSTNEGLMEIPFYLECGGDLRSPQTYTKDYFNTAYMPKLFFHYPEPEVTNSDEYKFVQSYMDQVGKAIKTGDGYEEYIDVDSWVDWFIIMEMSCNTDSGFWRSTFMYKRNGEKLMLGPLWDFDRAYGNFANDNPSYRYWSMAEQVYDLAQGHYMSYLYESDEFMEKVRDRWDEKKDELLATAIESVDEYGRMTRTSSVYNGRRWGTYVSEKNLENLKSFIKKRYTWIDESLHTEGFNRHPAPFTVSDPKPDEPEAIDGIFPDGGELGPVLPDGTVPFPGNTDGTPVITETMEVTPGAPFVIPVYGSFKEPDDTGSENSLFENISVALSDFEKDDTWDEKTSVSFNFVNGGVTVRFPEGETGVTDEADSISIEGKRIKILAEGTYVFSGFAPDAQIYVDAPDDAKVHLIFNGLHLNCSDSAPLCDLGSGEVVITLCDGTYNALSDGKIYAGDAEDEGINACIYSKSDIAVNGGGYLNVEGISNNGIGSKDNIKIVSGNIYVHAYNNGIKGKDSVAFLGGNVIVHALGDAVKSDKKEVGFIYIDGGNMSFTAEDDAFQCSGAFILKSGKVHVRCLGKTADCDGYKEGEESLNFVM